MRTAINAVLVANGVLNRHLHLWVDRRQLVHWSDTGIWEMTLVKFFPFTNDGMDLRKAPDGDPPSRGDPMHFRLSLAVSAVSSFVPV